MIKDGARGLFWTFENVAELSAQIFLWTAMKRSEIVADLEYNNGTKWNYCRLAMIRSKKPDLIIALRTDSAKHE